jgi:CBS domain containing-hemolysin-like protein
MMALWFLIVAPLLASAFFAGTELAVTMASRVRLRTRSGEGSRLAHLAERFLRRRERTITVCLVGNNLVNVALAVYGREALLRLRPMTEPVADAVATVLIVPLVLIFGEIFPKAVAQNYPSRLLMLSAPLLYVFRILLAPLLFVAVGVTELSRWLVGARGGLLVFASREELKQFVARSELRGHVDPDERDLIDRIVEFWKLDPRTLVRPLDSVTSVTTTSSVGEAKELMRSRGITRLPVIDSDVGDVVGVVSAAGLLGAADSEALSRRARPPVRAHLDAGLDRLLGELQRSTSQIAVVEDAAGRAGVILLDDLVQALLGGREGARRSP